MHCLGAVSSGSASPQRAGNCGSVLGVVRALGVLVSEGRVQGPPRGYKEGPHCAAPLQPPPNNHVCEKDNYLCDRYVILVREIADRVNTRSYLCVEVLLCTDCPCGLAKATCKDPVLPIPSMSITPWQQSSEMLLEYWCISVVSSKGPEMMNNQSLYQAVRSRLHFSQVAAWWSRSKGSAPCYITTRVVSYSEDNLRKFRETPSEHTFPLAACGDGNSIKVTVWALPRVEDVPILNCPMHPVSDREDEGAARALTPTKNIPAQVTSTNPEAFVLPTLVDDRLQAPCNEPGKHHCRCEEEDGCPPSPSVRTNGERKRRRSLPRGPDFIPSAIPHTSTTATSVLPSVCELVTRERENRIPFNGNTDCSNTVNYNSGINNLNTDGDLDSNINQIRCSNPPFFNDEQSSKESLYFDNQINTNGDLSTERNFGSIQEQESNVEKRYKCSSVVESSTSVNLINGKSSLCDDNNKPYASCRRERSEKLKKQQQQPNFEQEQSSSSSFNNTSNQSSMGNINWTTSTISGKVTECGDNKRDKLPIGYVQADNTKLPIIHNKTNFVVDPFNESCPFHESNPGPSTYIYNDRSKLQQTSLVLLSGNRDTRDKSLAMESSFQNAEGNESINKDTDVKKLSTSNNDLSNLMSKLKFPEEIQDRTTNDDKGIFHWISKVPSRVFNVATYNGFTDCKLKSDDIKIEERNVNDDGVAENKSKHNCNLELSQREFDEVLAVLRARTPAGRRRTQMRTIKRRDKIEKQIDELNCEEKYEFKDKKSSDLNSRNLIADRLGIEKLHGNCNDETSARAKDNEGIEAPCRNIRKVVYPNKSIQRQSTSMERSSWVTGKGKFGSNVTNDKSNKSETQLGVNNNTDECFYNVTNKADVLLGAILRTSKEKEEPRKGLLDISNGARPRTVTSDENCDKKINDVHIREGEKLKKKTSGMVIKPFEDDKSLPLSLNKRISQLKQLFKKEEDKKETFTSQQYCYNDHITNCDESINSALTESKLSIKNLKHSSRVKRKIDFSDIPKSGKSFDEDYKESPIPIGQHTTPSTNSIYQNPLFNGIINYKMQNSLPMKMKDQSLPPTNEQEKELKKDRKLSSSNSFKHSTNLKLRINRRENDDGFIHHQDNIDNFDPSIISQRRDDDDKRNYISSAVIKEHQNHSDLEINDASDRGVPSVIEQERFRRSLGNAASMVFHSRTGLPLTSSPAPLRRGSCCFDYDSSLNSVSSKRSALFELNTPPSPGAVSLEEGDREAENICEGEEEMPKRRTPSRGLPHSHALLGSFEESALNGRLEPVSTVHGFTAELGASGSFCPKHKKLPVTVFFYTLGDNDKVSTPYLAHINLGKKGYQVPRSGTIQVTLLNPLGTVVKMFVVMYDLSDMPSRSHTFLRQRTLRDKTLRYLIHLRFMSGKSGRIYLHTDIRMIICRKSDVDTASDLGAEPPKELRSFVHGPTNPKFSPRC